MQNNKPLIIWEKWIDPFGTDTDETLWTDYNNENNLIENPDEEDDEVNQYLQKNIIKNTSKPVRVIASPLGLIPYNEHTASSKIFNFWIGHTNFNISQSVKDIIEKVGGVEILDIFTRYRFRIAVGKCFNDSETMKLINDEVYAKIEDANGK